MKKISKCEEGKEEEGVGVIIGSGGRGRQEGGGGGCGVGWHAELEMQMELDTGLGGGGHTEMLKRDTTGCSLFIVHCSLFIHTLPPPPTTLSAHYWIWTTPISLKAIYSSYFY